MKEPGKPTEHERRDWVIILIILLIGFLCVILAGSWAIRFAPLWRLDTNMRSNLDPDSDFLTDRPSGFFVPLDPSILTQPVWINGFLTPGASFPTRTPVPPTNTPLPTNTLPIPSNTPTRIPPSPTSTLPYFPPPTRTSIPNTPLPPSTFTSTPPPTVTSADLSITKTDNATHYVADATKTYVIVVTNNGPSDVTGATVTDTFTNPNILSGSPTWTCFGTGGGACIANGSGDINDTVNLPAGASVTYLVDITVVSSPSGPLENTAAVTAPSGVTDPVPGNNSATDSDTLITTNPPPGVEIGPGNGSWYFFDPADSAITLAIPPITRDDDPDYDLVYYELANNSGIFMDHVIVQIGDGSNWYTIMNWGDGISDTNTGIAIPLGTPPNPTDCSGEPDNCEISAAFLRNGTGVQIDISIVPDGVYSYLRIQSLSTGDGDGADLDAIEILP
jgi:uncharacterized repeat protein (TIGR01451 family)